MYQMKTQAKKTFNKYKNRFKAKVKRLEKKGIDVSKYIDTSIPQSFNSKKEYMAWKKKVDDFTDRNSKDFRVITVKRQDGYKFHALAIEKRLLNENTKKAIQQARRKKEELMKLPVFDAYGEVVSSVKEQQEMFKDNERGFVKEPKLRDLTDLPNRNTLVKRLDTMEERANDNYYERRNEQMRENFTKLLRTAFGDLADMAIDSLYQLSHDEFVEMYYMFNNMDFAIYSSELGYLSDREHNEAVNEITNAVRLYKNGKADYEYKNF